jgi:hypothetical protein
MSNRSLLLFQIDTIIGMISPACFRGLTSRVLGGGEMTPADCIKVMAERIVREYDPVKIILFGSHARGEAGPDSDIDVLVVLPEVANKRQTAVISPAMASRSKTPYDPPQGTHRSRAAASPAGTLKLSVSCTSGWTWKPVFPSEPPFF